MPQDYAETIQEFRDAFDHMYALRFLSETPKIHVLYSHLETFMDIQAKNSRWTQSLADCQGLEACHSGLKKSDLRHNCTIKNSQVVLSFVFFTLSSTSYFFFFLTFPKL